MLSGRSIRKLAMAAVLFTVLMFASSANAAQWVRIPYGVWTNPWVTYVAITNLTSASMTLDVRFYSSAGVSTASDTHTITLASHEMWQGSLVDLHNGTTLPDTAVSVFIQNTANNNEFGVYLVSGYSYAHGIHYFQSEEFTYIY